MKIDSKKIGVFINMLAIFIGVVCLLWCCGFFNFNRVIHISDLGPSLLETDVEHCVCSMKRDDILQGLAYLDKDDYDAITDVWQIMPYCSTDGYVKGYGIVVSRLHGGDAVVVLDFSSKIDNRLVDIVPLDECYTLGEYVSARAYILSRIYDEHSAYKYFLDDFSNCKDVTENKHKYRIY